jgi:dTDP-4-dehydrorhamnose 3,5-epimerase
MLFEACISTCPPKDHAKLIYVTSGAILDVVLDLRSGSPTYGEHIATQLSQDNKKMIFIPTGCAHGFLSLEDDTCTIYFQSSTYSKDHDTGVRYDSFNMDWKVKDPLVSKRDKELVALQDFISPFNYKRKK